MRAEDYAMWAARLEQNPQSVEAHNALSLHAMRARDLEAALEHNRQALTLAPNNAEALTFAANLAAAAHLYDRAIAILEHVVDEHPQHGFAWALMGIVHLQTGTHDQALLALEKAQALMDDPSVRLALQEVRTLTSEPAP